MPSSITRQLACLIPVLLHASVLHGQRGHEEGFVVCLGEDTLAVERYTRSATTLASEIVLRVPAARRVTYTAALNAVGDVMSMDLVVTPLLEDSRPPRVSRGLLRFRGDTADVQLTLILGALLTIAIIYLFLNSWRSTVITGLTLPVSIISAFFAMWAMGFTLNTMTLLALSLAIGLLIDDAIVVRENIVRHVAMGKDHLPAARDGTDEIGLAVVATTLAVIAVITLDCVMPSSAPAASGGEMRMPWRATKMFSPEHSATKPCGESMIASS